jgi:uncharacterized linocin/CFP29 family protein
MSNFNRDLAPLSPAAWQEIDDEARNSLKVLLAGRKLVDFSGPAGWNLSAVTTGRAIDIGSEAPEGVQIRKRVVQPLVELRREFEIRRTETDAIDRGAKDADLDPVAEAARAIALAEDGAIFNGLADADIPGMKPSAAHDALTISTDYENYPAVVAQAITTLRNAGIGGPYSIALGPRCYTGLNETTVNGFPVINHVARLIDGAIISAPAIDGAIVLSSRGGDFEFCCGRDFSIGYLDHDATSIQLYIEESFTFRVLGADALVPLAYRKR